MTENRATAILQTSSQALIVAAGVLYLVGFITVSVFDSTYGIVDFSFLRAKVIAVGILFMIFVALAMLLTFRMFSIFGLSAEQSEISAVAFTPENASLTSPIHVDAAGNPLPWNPWSPSEVQAHHDAEEITDADHMARAVEALHAAFLATYGQQAYILAATDPSVQPEKK